MYRSGPLRTIVHTTTRKRNILPLSSSQILALKVSTKTVSNQDETSQDNKSTNQKLRRYIHTTRKRYSCNTPMTFEPWTDEDIICVLQGTCMPGSTRYCRTNSMFGKLDLSDIMQGVPTTRKFSTLSGNAKISPIVRGYHSNSGRTSLTASKNPLLLFTNCSTGNDLQAEFVSRNSNITLSNVVNEFIQHRQYTLSSVQNTAETNNTTASDTPRQLTQREKLKRAVKEYGGTVVVFHVGISLASLGGFYLAVSSGLDMTVLLKSIGFSAEMVQSKLATGASTFVVAYAVHKMFAPVRIGITLTTCPFLVRYLRKVGVLKPPK
ncbi:uncharacterized protein [Antedon mediterranea]|uniref:uncharacterized protein isoform X2 n=1 Tax=Antedon mediterranea TaxID=105859 RepID=UPI003AF885FA